MESFLGFMALGVFIFAAIALASEQVAGALREIAHAVDRLKQDK